MPVKQLPVELEYAHVSMELHHGQILEKVIRRNGYSISELARLTNVNRRSVYNWFTQKRLKPDLVYRIGTILNYDFSMDLPDLFPGMENAGRRVVYTPNMQAGIQSEGEPTDDGLYWKNKYIELLERYNKFLMACIEKNQEI